MAKGGEHRDERWLHLLIFAGVVVVGAVIVAVVTLFVGFSSYKF